jgi:hypothetical protein
VGVRRLIAAAFAGLRRLTDLRLVGKGLANALTRSPVVSTPLRILRAGLWLGVQYLTVLPKIHTNGCGDFTLLARDAWFKLRGYPELPIWSMHLDSLFCYMAVADGISEIVLRKPKAVFHLEHENSWVVLTPDDRLRTFATKPWLDIGLLAELWSTMYCTAQPVNFNSADWGLASLVLDEVWIEGGKKRMVKQGSDDFAATGS